MNRCTERLYNGLIKEIQPLSDARNVSDACGDDFCNQRNRNGTFYNRSTGAVQYADLHAA